MSLADWENSLFNPSGQFQEGLQVLKAISNRIRFSFIFRVSVKIRMILNPCHCVVSDHWVSRKNTVAQIEEAFCCVDCETEHSGPGKFQGFSDAERRGKALILNAWSLDSREDDHMSSDGNEYVGKFGNFLLFVDWHGFVDFEEFDSEKLAQSRFDDIYNDGMGASESDAYIEHSGYGRWDVSFDGKPLNIWPNNNGEITERRCIARVRLETMRTGFYPNLWVVSDHGNLRLTSF